MTTTEVTVSLAGTTVEVGLGAHPDGPVVILCTPTSYTPLTAAEATDLAAALAAYADVVDNEPAGSRE